MTLPVDDYFKNKQLYDNLNKLNYFQQNLTWIYFSDFFLLLIIKGKKRFLKEESLAIKIEIFIFFWQVYLINYKSIQIDKTNIVFLI
jgi:hypothetical protein